MSAAFTVTFVRHGETHMNAKRLMQGHTDTPLSEIGMEQAKKLGRHLSSTTTFTSVYSSDLQRAFKTAELILGELNNITPEIIKDQRLRERCFGELEGQPPQELGKRAAALNLSIDDFAPEGGETMTDLSKRVGSFFDDLCKLYSEDQNQHILVASHGGWICCLMKYLSQSTTKYELQNFIPSQAIRIHSNTGISVLTITPSSTEQSTYKLDFLKVNNTAHLATEST